MTVRLAINGFGRTGRSLLRSTLSSSHEIEVVAINDLGSPEALTRLFARDSVHGRFPEPVRVDDGAMIVGSRRIAILGESEPKALPWGELGLTWSSSRRAGTPVARRRQLTSKRAQPES